MGCALCKSLARELAVAAVEMAAFSAEIGARIERDLKVPQHLYEGRLRARERAMDALFDLGQHQHVPYPLASLLGSL